jgi:hypothetical protein
MKALARVLAAAAVTLLATLLMASTAYGARPQQADAPPQPAPAAPPQPDTRPPVVPESELTLHYYTPRHSDGRELAQVLTQVAGRMYHAQAQDGSTSPPVANVRTFGNVVVLYDRAKRIEELVTILARLEEASAATRADVQEFVVEEYAPHYLPADALLEALRPLRREIWLPSTSGGRTPGSPSTKVDNVTALEQPATLVLRDTIGNVKAMVALLERLDVPPPQAQLTCWLLRGADEDTATDLPRDLVDNLSRIVPQEHFRRLCVTMIRTSVQPGQTQKLRSEFVNDDFTDSFELMLVPAGYDRDTGALPISRCRFEATTGQAFETSLTLKAGEYTVLGAAGVDPLFVVLQVTPLDG